MRLALIANRASGSATDPDAIAAVLGRGGATVDVYDVRAGADALAHDPDRIVVAGGDGSLGPYAALAAERGLPLAVIPTGTANDFARALEVPREWQAAAALAGDAGARTREVEILRAGERPFLNAASAGLSVRAAERADGLKRRLGPLAYAVGAARAGLTAQPLRICVRIDGAQVFNGPAWQVIVAGTGAFGGGAEVGDADPHDGLADVAIIEGGHRTALVRRAYGMRAGSLAAQDGVDHRRGRAVEIDLADPSFNVDGELLRIDPARFTARGERVAVVVGA